MALRTKTIEYAFDPRFSVLATATTLAAATRHDFAALTLDIPENASRTFRSVHVVMSWNDANTVTYTIAGWRIGIKLGAVAFTDTDYTPTAIANTGDHEFWERWHDVTAYFQTNFGSGTSQTCQVGFAASTATASNINGITAKLVITYEYDDTNATTRVKTVRIPIQSHHTTLTNALQEFGTITGTNNAPANQIPALDTFLPEASKSYKRVWFEAMANDGGASTVDTILGYQIDSQTEITRNPTTEQALTTARVFRDMLILDTVTSANPNYIATNAAHALKARDTTTTARFECFGGILYVTYTYDHANSTSIMNSLVMPMNDDDIETNWVQATAAADQNVIEFKPWIEEPGTITIKQSGVQIFGMAPGGATFDVGAGSQTMRPYGLGNYTNAGGSVIHHRVDHGSGWTLARGMNTLQLKMFTTGAAAMGLYGVYLFLNYTSDKATAGDGAHAHSTSWYLADYQTTGAVATVREIATTNQRTPNIPETNYFLVSAGYELLTHIGATGVTFTVLAELLSGEYQADGWKDVLKRTAVTDAELSSIRAIGRFLLDWNRTNLNTGAMNIESARKYRIFATTGTHVGLRMWVTYHSHTWQKTGAVSGYSGDGSGITVRLYDTTDDVELCTVTTTTGGNYTVTWFDNTRTYYVTVRQDDTHVGRSGDWTF